MPTEVSISQEKLSEASKAEAYLLMIVFVWGINFAIVKAALSQFLPHAFNGIRFILASLLLLVVARSRGLAMPCSWREAGIMFGLGLLYTTFYQVLFIEGIARTTAANSGLILGATPVFVALAGHFAGRDRLNLRTGSGIVLAFAGLFLLIEGGPGKPSWSDETFKGDFLILGATLLWSAYTVIVRPFISRYSTARLTYLTTLLGTLPLMFWCVPSFARQDWHAIGPAAWLAVAFSGLFSIGLAYLAWNNSVSKVGPTRTAIYSNLVPIIAVFAGVLFLNEPLNFLQSLGAAAVLIGIALTRWR